MIVRRTPLQAIKNYPSQLALLRFFLLSLKNQKIQLEGESSGSSSTRLSLIRLIRLLKYVISRYFNLLVILEGTLHGKVDLSYQSFSFDSFLLTTKPLSQCVGITSKRFYSSVDSSILVGFPEVELTHQSQDFLKALFKKSLLSLKLSFQAMKINSSLAEKRQTTTVCKLCQKGTILLSCLQDHSNLCKVSIVARKELESVTSQLIMECDGACNLKLGFDTLYHGMTNLYAKDIHDINNNFSFDPQFIHPQQKPKMPKTDSSGSQQKAEEDSLMRWQKVRNVSFLGGVNKRKINQLDMGHKQSRLRHALSGVDNFELEGPDGEVSTGKSFHKKAENNAEFESFDMNEYVSETSYTDIFNSGIPGLRDYPHNAATGFQTIQDQIQANKNSGKGSKATENVTSLKNIVKNKTRTKRYDSFVSHPASPFVSNEPDGSPFEFTINSSFTGDKMVGNRLQQRVNSSTKKGSNEQDQLGPIFEDKIIEGEKVGKSSSSSSAQENKLQEDSVPDDKPINKTTPKTPVDPTNYTSPILPIGSIPTIKVTPSEQSMRSIKETDSNTDRLQEEIFSQTNLTSNSKSCRSINHGGPLQRLMSLENISPAEKGSPCFSYNTREMTKDLRVFRACRVFLHRAAK